MRTVGWGCKLAQNCVTLGDVQIPISICWCCLLFTLSLTSSFSVFIFFIKSRLHNSQLLSMNILKWFWCSKAERLRKQNLKNFFLRVTLYDNKYKFCQATHLCTKSDLNAKLQEKGGTELSIWKKIALCYLPLVQNV